MLRSAFILGLLAAVLCASPVFALTAQEKQKTCNFGADDQKLTGPQRKTFLKNCMADEAGAPKAAKPAKPAAPPAAQ